MDATNFCTAPWLVGILQRGIWSMEHGTTVTWNGRQTPKATIKKTLSCSLPKTRTVKKMATTTSSNSLRTHFELLKTYKRWHGILRIWRLTMNIPLSYQTAQLRFWSYCLCRPHAQSIQVVLWAWFQQFLYDDIADEGCKVLSSHVQLLQLQSFWNGIQSGGGHEQQWQNYNGDRHQQSRLETHRSHRFHIPGGKPERAHGIVTWWTEPFFGLEYLTFNVAFSLGY